MTTQTPQETLRSNNMHAPLISPDLRRRFAGGLTLLIAGIASIPGVVWLDNVMSEHAAAELKDHKDRFAIAIADLGLTSECEAAFSNPTYRKLKQTERYAAVFDVCGGSRADFGSSFETVTAMETYVASAEKDATTASVLGIAAYALPLGAVVAGALAANSALASSAVPSRRRESSQSAALTVTPQSKYEAEVPTIPLDELPSRVVMGSGGGPVCFIGPCPGPTRVKTDA